MIRIAKLVVPATALVCLALPGCGGSGLTTGSLFGGSSGPAPAAAVVETPSMRAAQVAAVSARAAKCGYNFDPVRLKAGFLDAEVKGGAAVQDMTKVEREYDAIRAKVAATVAADPDFCTDAKTREIKTDLSRHIAGDYSLPVNKRAIDERLLASGPRTREVLNPDFVNDKWANKTKRVEE